MLVSIIIPAFDGEGRIAECIDAILDGTASAAGGAGGEPRKSSCHLQRERILARVRTRLVGYKAAFYLIQADA